MSPLAWYKKYVIKQQEQEPDKESFVFGSAVDIKAFTPQEFDNRFVVMDEGKLPSEVIRKIIDNYHTKIIVHNQQQRLLQFELPVEPELLEQHINHDEALLSSIEGQNWQSNWKADTKLTKVKEQGEGYFKSLVEAGGRTIISQQTALEAEELVNILQSHSLVKDYFVPSEGNELLFQLEIFTKYESVNLDTDIDVKGALDILQINHKNKTVQIVDFKTAYSAFEFLFNARKYNYPLQLSFYTYLVEEWLKNTEYHNYTVIPPMNIVIDKFEKTPYIYAYTEEQMVNYRYGRVAYYNIEEKKYYKRVLGWVETLENIMHHFAIQNWTAPIEMITTGKIMINLD